METVPIGQSSLSLAFIQQVPIGKVQGLAHVASSKSGQVWLLPEKALCRSCFVPDVSVVLRPGQGQLFLRFHDAHTFWAIELAELTRLDERATLILEYAEMLHKHFSAVPTYENYREFQDAVGRLPKSAKGPCKKDPHTFDHFITFFDEARARAKALVDYPAGTPVGGKEFEFLLVEYDLWNDLQPRVKGFIRSDVKSISADGRHEHSHPVGLTTGRCAELIRIAAKLAEAMKNAEAGDDEGGCE